MPPVGGIGFDGLSLHVSQKVICWLPDEWCFCVIGSVRDLLCIQQQCRRHRHQKKTGNQYCQRRDFHVVLRQNDNGYGRQKRVNAFYVFQL